MNDVLTDLKVSDNFHRMKRTLLLFCAAMAVLALATPSDSRNLNASIISLALSSDAVKWLLGLAGFYYWIGFGFEILTAVRQNAARMNKPTTDDIEKELSTLQMNVPSLKAQGDALAERPDHAAAEAGRRLVMVLEHLDQAVRNELPSWRRFNRDVKLQRRAYFWGWEVASGVAAFPVAALLLLGVFDTPLRDAGLLAAPPKPTAGAAACPAICRPAP